ncbi:MAG TPA: SDR family NAD(P)-dependent oxidoreductase [Novosphingobium sp.]|nr:SDR family NAD(P)-dependent oxidoreductase [Novosphingobium sp.]
MTQHGETALVTGASSGLGEEYCRQLADRCTRIIAVARRLDRLEALGQELAGKAELVPVQADLATQEGVARTVEAMERHGPVDILVNNAGYSPYSTFAESVLDEQRGMIPLHCDATISLCHAALPAMLEKGRGTIINVSSVGSFVTGPTLTVYSGTKAFINYFSMSLRSEVKDRGIEIQVMCPGFVHTGLHAPMEKQGFDKGAFPELWMHAPEAVAASVEAIGTGQLFVIPGERNAAFSRHAVQALLDSLPGG